MREREREKQNKRNHERITVEAHNNLHAWFDNQAKLGTAHLRYQIKTNCQSPLSQPLPLIHSHRSQKTEKRKWVQLMKRRRRKRTGLFTCASSEAGDLQPSRRVDVGEVKEHRLVVAPAVEPPGKNRRRRPLAPVPASPSLPRHPAHQPHPASQRHLLNVSGLPRRLTASW